MFPTALQTLAEVNGCIRGYFKNIYTLNDYIVGHFSETKRFREHFEATTFEGTSVGWKEYENKQNVLL
jgi:hypothetical protein